MTVLPVSNSLDRYLRTIALPHWEVRVVGLHAAFYVPAGRWRAVEKALGDAGISFRGISAIAIGRKFLSYIACDTAEDQAKAIAALKKLK